MKTNRLGKVATTFAGLALAAGVVNAPKAEAALYKVDYTTSYGAGHFEFDDTRLTQRNVYSTSIEYYDPQGLSTFNGINTNGTASGVGLTISNNFSDGDWINVYDNRVYSQVVYKGATSLWSDMSKNTLMTALATVPFPTSVGTWQATYYDGSQRHRGLPVSSYSFGLVPEPASLGLLGLGASALVLGRQRKTVSQPNTLASNEIASF